MERRSSVKTRRVQRRTNNGSNSWEERATKDKQISNDDNRWGIMRENRRTNIQESAMIDAGPENQHSVNRVNHVSTRIGDKEYDLSRLNPLKKSKGKDVTFSTHNFNGVEPKQQVSLPGQPIYSNSSRLRYQLKIKPALPQETYDYPICGNMEYGWNWLGKDIDGIFGSLNCNPIKLAMNRWKLEKKS